MRTLRLAFAVVAALLALGAVLLSLDVGRWHDRLASNDRAVAVNPTAAVAAVPSTIVPLDPARNLVGLDDDIRLRRAIQAFVVARHTAQGFDNGQERSRRVEIAESALEDVALQGSPTQVSRADVLLGVLMFGGKKAPAGVASPAEASVNAFTEAARLDPSSLPAKFDLELALRALAPSAVRPGSDPSAGKKGQSETGAGSGLPGNGF